MMKKRKFYIPMFIFLGLATFVFLFSQILGIDSYESIKNADSGEGSVAEILVVALIALPFYFIGSFISWILVVPVLILGIIYVVIANKKKLQKWPAVMSIAISISYLIIPLAYILFLGIR